MAKNDFFMYKNKPLVRCGDTLYYGNMTDPYVVRITIKTKKKVNDMEIADKVFIQLMKGEITNEKSQQEDNG